MATQESGCTSPCKISLQALHIPTGTAVVVVVADTRDHRLSGALSVKILCGSRSSGKPQDFGKGCTGSGNSVVENAVNLEAIKAKDAQRVIGHKCVREHACA